MVEASSPLPGKLSKGDALMAEPPFRAAVLDAGGTPAGGRRGFSSRPASGLAELQAGSEARDGADACGLNLGAKQ